MSKFEVYRSAAGYRWRLKASNGEVMAMSDQYATKGAAKHGCAAARRAANDADVVEIKF